MDYFYWDASALAKRYTLVLITSDLRLLSAAQAEGLRTFNPETDNQAILDIFIDSP